MAGKDVGGMGAMAQVGAAAVVVSDGKKQEAVGLVTYAASAYNNKGAAGQDQVTAAPSNGEKVNGAAADIGVGGGFIVTNAQNADDLRGPATTETWSVGPFGVQKSESQSGVVVYFVGISKGWGLGYTKQPTNTVACTKDGCK